MHALEPQIVLYAIIGTLVLAGVSFAGMWAAVNWVKRQILVILNEWAKSDDFNSAIEKARAPVVAQKVAEVRMEVHDAVDEHNECEEAHAVALRPYVTREEVLLRLTTLETDLSGFKELTDSKIEAMHGDIKQLAFDIRNGGLRQAGGPAVPRQ
jgi:hypothetical protein